MDAISYRRAGCPINNTLETFGDRWSLIILRDSMFGGRRRTFRSYLTESIEGIASNILADRLKRLTVNGLLTRCADPRHKQRVVYSLTEKAIELVPLMAVMGSWGYVTRARRRTSQPVRKSSRTAVRNSGPSSWTSCAISTWARRNPRYRPSQRCRWPTRPPWRLKQRRALSPGLAGEIAGYEELRSFARPPR